MFHLFADEISQEYWRSLTAALPMRSNQIYLDIKKKSGVY
jgi:hypothetical protein